MKQLEDPTSEVYARTKFGGDYGSLRSIGGETINKIKSPITKRNFDKIKDVIPDDESIINYSTKTPSDDLKDHVQAAIKNPSFSYADESFNNIEDAIKVYPPNGITPRIKGQINARNTNTSDTTRLIDEIMTRPSLRRVLVHLFTGHSDIALVAKEFFPNYDELKLLSPTKYLLL